ncbi:MAG: acetylgalactosaminidase, partial [Chitinophagaceae bacterium]
MSTSNRRKFIRNFTLGASVIATGLESKAEAGFYRQSATASQNMCGYAAPKLDTVRIGIVGLGMRGSDAVERLSFLDGVEITALCDKLPERVEKAQATLSKMGRPKAASYSGAEGYKALCERNDVDLVYTPTPW